MESSGVKEEKTEPTLVVNNSHETNLEIKEKVDGVKTVKSEEYLKKDVNEEENVAKKELDPLIQSFYSEVNFCNVYFLGLGFEEIIFFTKKRLTK